MACAFLSFVMLANAHTVKNSMRIGVPSTSGASFVKDVKLGIEADIGAARPVLMPTSITKVTVQSTDPGYPGATGVTKTGSPAGGDLVVVDLVQQGTTAQGKVLVVLKIKANTGMTVTLSGGKATVNGSGNGATHYAILELATADASNWTVDVSTSGGSRYSYIKGTGG